MPKLLSVRKTRWVDQFKPKQVKGAPLNYNAAAIARYYKKLQRLVDAMTADVERRLERFFKADHAQEYFAQDASVASQARILMNELSDKFDTLFSVNAKPFAHGMTDDAIKSSEVALKSSLKELSGGLTLNTDILTGPLKDVLTATIAENVGLIKSISAQYLQGVQGAVMRSITTGNGLADLVPFLQTHKGVTLRRARTIANDQTRKAFNNINKERMTRMGLDEFEWLHSGGGAHPRQYHQQSYKSGGLNGGVYSLTNLPVIDKKTGERGIPGQLIKCRCRMRPVIKFNEG